MFNFQAHITENGKSRLYSMMSSSDNSFTRAAHSVMQNANVRDGGHVRIALMTFDHPSQNFSIMTYEFDVVDGKVENLHQA